MASCSSLVSEEQVLCSICLEVFTAPVSIPCGHNFCKACLSNYWDTTVMCQCPLCKDKFSRRPELHVNTTLRDIAENLKRIKVRDEERSPVVPARPGEVPCDVCTGKKLRAMKSCLVCQISYCETHLEPHLRVAGLKKHKVIHPVANLEDRMCKRHDKLLELFCKEDQTCVCLMCMNTDHKTHNAVPLEEECGERMAKLGKMMADIDQKMVTRSRKVQQIKLSVELSKRRAQREISDSVEVFTALVTSIEKSQAELIQVIEEKQKATEKQADRFIKELEQEITKLRRRSSELQQLSHSEDDNLQYLQSFPSLSTPSHTKDWSEISVCDLSVVEEVRRALSQLEGTLMKDIKRMCAAEPKRIQQYAADVTLDPDTANSWLILSKDGKQVKLGDAGKNLPASPKRFDSCASVLGKQGRSSGRFYYEVQVGGKTQWGLGVARESINRKGLIRLNPGNGYWVIVLRNGERYEAAAERPVLLSLREKPHTVGVFVDCEVGQVSFYNVEARSLIYSYTGCTFTEKLYPYLSPGRNDGGKNTAPLIISLQSLTQSDKQQ